MTGLMLAGLAASAAGAGQSIAASNSAAANENAIVGNEIKTQQAASKKDQSILGQNLEKSTPEAAQQQIGQGAKLAQGLYNQVSQNPSTQTGSLIGAKNQESGNEQGGDYNKLIQAPAAQLQGLGQLGVDQSLQNQLTGTQLSSTNFLSGLSSQSMPYLLNAAAQQGSEGQAIGSLLSSMGGLAAVGGASGLGRLANTGNGAYSGMFTDPNFGAYGLMPGGGLGNAGNYQLGQIPG